MMSLKTVAAAALIDLALSAGVFTATASHTMYLTFSAAVGLPGITLPAGAYMFERVETASRIDLVRVRSREHNTVYLTAFTNMVPRPRNLGSDQWVTFREMKPGTAPQIAVWFPPGEAMGHQFVY